MYQVVQCASMDRNELLERVLDEARENGLTGRSLRDLAAAVGTSHRMLLHYFGSQANLVAAIVDEIAAAEHGNLAAISHDDPDAAVVELWEHASAAENRPHLRLLFSAYGRAIEGAEPFTQLLPDVVDDWVHPARAASTAEGDPRTAEARARLGLAVVRGLTLDLMTTDDHRAVDDAFQYFVSLISAEADG